MNDSRPRRIPAVSRLLGHTAALIAAVGLVNMLWSVPAVADASSGPTWETTTGPYYPSWYADDCLKATVTTYADNIADIYAYYDPNGCSGSGANMASGWLGIMAGGFHNGSFCGDTGYYYTSTNGQWNLGVGATECSGQLVNGDAYNTVAYGEAWDYFNGSYQYVSAGNLSSPSQTYP